MSTGADGQHQRSCCWRRCTVQMMIRPPLMSRVTPLSQEAWAECRKAAAEATSWGWRAVLTAEAYHRRHAIIEQVISAIRTESLALAGFRADHLPPRRVNELRGGVLHPLSDPHRQPHIGSPGRPQVRQTAWCAVNLVCQRRPCQTVITPLCIQRGVQLAQIPPEPAIRACLRQLNVTHLNDRTGEEVLRRAVDPPQQDQRVLTGHRAS
jgi:hypothetical protein